MPTFAYTARDQRGSAQTGSIDATDEEQVIAMLQQRGLLVTSISQKTLLANTAPATPSFRRRRPRRLHGRVTTEDQVLLCQQLATLIESGVPLLKSLEVVSAQLESRRLLLVLDEVRHDVQAGSTLKDAMAKHRMVFSKLWLNLIGTGESSGHLAQALHQLARHFQSQHRLQNAAKLALTYPAVLIVAIIGVLAVFVYFIIPRFTTVFAQSGMQLPLLTRLIIACSKAARQYWVVIVAVVVAISYGMRQYLRTEVGQWMRDRLLLWLPGFGQLFAEVQLAEFSHGFSTLLESGVPLLTALEILEDSATNKVYGQAAGYVREKVKMGRSISETMDEAGGLFPPMVVQMMLVGEEVGELSKMALRVSTYYEDRVELFIARLSRLFEPVAIICVAILVFIIVLAIFLPIVQFSTGATL